MKSRDRVVFLVGAGLAKDANLPMSVELATKLKKNLEDAAIQSEDPDGADKAKRLLALFRLLNGGVRFQEGFLDRDPDAPVNIEQIAIAALSLRKRLEHPVAPYTSGWHQRLSELEAVSPDLMQEFEEFIYSRLTDWLSLPDDASISYLARLADALDLDVAIDIFSLNYDLCVETAIQTRGLEWVNGFSENGWNARLFERDVDVRLFKLHGSLDWVDDEAYGVCSLQIPKHKDAEDIAGTHRPLLIFGTDHKLSARQPFLTLAYHLSQAILGTRILVTIGYSFGDAYVNEIIEQGFRNNSLLRIVVVSPQASLEVSRRALFRGSPKVMAIDRRAKEALNDGHIRVAIRDFIEESSEDEVF